MKEMGLLVMARIKKGEEAAGQDERITECSSKIEEVFTNWDCEFCEGLSVV
jgi:hypothetical protein